MTVTRSLPLIVATGLLGLAMTPPPFPNWGYGDGMRDYLKVSPIAVNSVAVAVTLKPGSDPAILTAHYTDGTTMVLPSKAGAGTTIIPLGTPTSKTLKGVSLKDCTPNNGVGGRGLLYWLG